MVGGVRTDNDTWDIPTSVGVTALFVAAARVLHAQRDEPLAVDQYAEVFCRAVGGSWADVLDGKAPDHRLKTEWGEVFQTFQGARTRFFDHFLRRATAERGAADRDPGRGARFPRLPAGMAGRHRRLRTGPAQ